MHNNLTKMYGYDLPIDALRVLREGEHEDIMNYIKNPKSNVFGVETDPELLAIQNKMEKLLDDGRHSGGSWCFTLSIVRAILRGTYSEEELLEAKRKEDEEYELLKKRREEEQMYKRISDRVAIREKELEIELREKRKNGEAEETDEEVSLRKAELAWEAWDAEREEQSASKMCRGNRGSI